MERLTKMEEVHCSFFMQLESYTFERERKKVKDEENMEIEFSFD